jgi:hypothetical protein
MFARIKKSGQYQYLQVVENSKVDGKVRQRILSTVGRLDHLQVKGNVETLIRSLARFSDKALLVLSGKVEVDAHAVTIGPALIIVPSRPALNQFLRFEGQTKSKY